MWRVRISEEGQKLILNYQNCGEVVRERVGVPEKLSGRVDRRRKGEREAAF